MPANICGAGILSARGELQKAEEDYTREMELTPTGWENWYARAAFCPATQSGESQQ